MEALTGTGSLSPCAKVSAASKGEIDVEFKVKDQVVSIGIVAVQPNTQVKLKCATSTGVVAKTVRLHNDGKNVYRVKTFVLIFKVKMFCKVAYSFWVVSIRRVRFTHLLFYN